MVVEKPRRKIDDLITDIREKESTIHLKDGSHEIRRNGTFKTRCDDSEKNYKSNLGNNNQPRNQGKWNFPFLPSRLEGSTWRRIIQEVIRLALRRKQPSNTSPSKVTQ